MNRADVELRRAVSDGDAFIIPRKDHLTIAGTKAAALTYAAIEWKAAMNGPGDTAAFVFSVADIIEWQGAVLAQSDRTVRTCLSHLLKLGILERCGKGRDNRFSVRIHWPTVNARIGKIAEPATPKPGKIAEPGAAKLPIPPIRTGERTIGKEPNPDGLGAAALKTQIEHLLTESGIRLHDTWERGGTVPSLVQAMVPAPEVGLLWLRGLLRDYRAGREAKPRSWGAVVVRARTHMAGAQAPAGEPVPAERPDAEATSRMLAELRAMSRTWKSCPAPARKPAESAGKQIDGHKREARA